VTRTQDRPLSLSELDQDPVAQFAAWFDAARIEGVVEPDAMALATATGDGAPSARMVLMKDFGDRGITFFTNYGSRKAIDLEQNPRAALLFYWPELGRQVRIEGRIRRAERADSVAYAHSRSRASQLSALASPQSRPVPNRQWLEERVAVLDREHPRGELPVSDEWGGYRLEPEAWEFWQHRANRLHDRFRYERSPTRGWTIARLGP
jgi:pyridoxamine 5'-phosphate oxidase